MGHKNSRATSFTSSDGSQRKRAFKLFEYVCPQCRSKRPIQYFHRDGSFLQQRPRVVCGECNNSVIVEPFKTVEYSCPSCKKWQKARIPGRPIPLNMYNVSVVSCNCGFKGEATVGRLMDILCGHCLQVHRELCDVWTEDNEEMRTFCGRCQDYQRSFAHDPKNKNAAETPDLEYECEQCSRVWPIHVADLLRSEGLISCSECNWVGYPAARARGHFENLRQQREERRSGSSRPSRGNRASGSAGLQDPVVSPKRDAGDRPKRPHERKVLSPGEPMSIMPGA